MPDDSAQQFSYASAGIISAMALGAAVVGFVLQLLVAYYFGASSATDSFFMAQSTSELLSKLLLGGSITAVFVPMFVERLTRGQRADAWQLGLNLLHVTSLVMLVVVVVLGIFAEPFVRFIAPGFSPEAAALTVSLLRILLPSFLFLFLVDMGTAMLHALKHFAVPASLRLVAPLVSLGAIVLLHAWVGIYALAIGALVGSCIQLFLIGATLWRKGFRYRFVFNLWSPDLKHLFYLVYPFIFSVLMTQVAGIVYRVLVSELAVGSLSALKYAEKIFQLLIVIFLHSITTVAYPLMAGHAAKHDLVALQETIGEAMRLIVFVTIPMIICVVMLRVPLVTFLFERGSFTAEDTQLTAQALLFFMIGLTTNGVSSVLGHATLALKQTRASVAVSIASHGVAVGLFVLLVPSLQHAGLALASSLVPLSIALLYFLYLLRFMPRLYTIFFHVTFVKTAVLGLGVAGVVSLLSSWLAPWHVGGREVALFVQLAVPTSVAGVLFVVCAYLWHIPEMRRVVEVASARIAKWRPRSLSGGAV